MPNHVDQALTIVGPEDRVAAFVIQAHAPALRTGDGEGSANHCKEPHIEMLSFHAIVPLPSEYHEVPYSGDGNVRGGYAMERDTWGVKWGAYSEQKPYILADRATYRFQCAWSPPLRWLEKASASWPELIFFLSWGGEGPTRGRAVYRRGEAVQLQDDGPSGDYPEYPDPAPPDFDEDAWHQAYTAVEQAYINSHQEWVGKLTNHRQWRLFLGANRSEIT